MFAGHVGVGLALARAGRDVNAAVWVAAALALDVVLWVGVLVGFESVHIPPDFARTHQAAYVFPYSHGLLAALLWSGVGGLVALGAVAGGSPARRRIAALLALAVVSHWGLDALVHRAEMPLAGAASRLVGLGLWDRLPLALALEGAITVAGAALFIAGSGLPRWRAIGVAALCALVLALNLAGMTVAPPPPSAAAMAGSSLATIGAVCAALGWLARRDAAPRPGAPGAAAASVRAGQPAALPGEVPGHRE